MSVPLKYTDDVFTGNRKYNVINNSDGTISLEDATTYAEEGTNINATLATQWVKLMTGFKANKTVFNSDGSITETGDIGTKITVFNDDGSITETLKDDNGNTLVHKTTFNEDSSISEEVTSA